MAEDFSDAFEELEDVFSEAIEWAGNTYPVIGAGSRNSSKLSAGGFGLDNDLMVTVRQNLFDNGLPQQNQTFIFTRFRADGTIVSRYPYAIAETNIMPGGLLKLTGVAESKGV